jgi:SAM-dependent methyltransferase
MATTLVRYTACPVCNSTELDCKFTAKDYTTSGETFEIWQCGHCQLRFTQNAPDAASMSPYYRSQNYISHTDTSEGFINRLYHLVRKRTLRSKSRLISRALQRRSTGQLLDLGAGTGAFVHFMQTRGWQATGLEPDPLARQRALERHQIRLLPAEDLMRLDENSFDAITLWHVLEHVHNLQAYLDQLKKLLRSEGRIFIAVPNYTCYDARVYNSHWAAYDVPRHLYHFSPASMNLLLERHGFKLLAIHPMWFDSYYISLLSEKYKSDRSRPIRGFLTGSISNLHALANPERGSSIIYVSGK